MSDTTHRRDFLKGVLATGIALSTKAASGSTRPEGAGDRQSARA